MTNKFINPEDFPGLKLIMCKGLPASGKSTWAKEMVKNYPGKYKRVNKDDLRAMIDCSKWSRENEKMILYIRDEIISKSLFENISIIVDDTNFDFSHEQQFIRLIENHNLESENKCSLWIQSFTHVPLEECLKRDAVRQASVGEKVICRMYNQYLKPKEIKTEVKLLEYNFDLPDCVIIDIDGTIADKGERNPYNFGSVDLDKPKLDIIKIINLFSLGYAREYNGKWPTFFFFSGREDINNCKQLTSDWLHLNMPMYWKDGACLRLRKLGDHRKDNIVKEEMYNEFVKDKYNVLAVFDDRNQVVEMWRSLGLTCLQVAEGNF